MLVFPVLFFPAIQETIIRFSNKVVCSDAYPALGRNRTTEVKADTHPHGFAGNSPDASAILLLPGRWSIAVRQVRAKPLPSSAFAYPRCLGEKIPDDVIFGPCSHLDSDGFKPTYHFRRISWEQSQRNTQLLSDALRAQVLEQ